jgi:long-chain acyl-CoA synthetase
MASDSENIAYVYPDGLRTRQLSYAELTRLAWRSGRWMLSKGIQPGDRVLLWGANRGEWAAVFWGCLATGIVAVPIDAQSSREYVVRIAEETQARLLWADDPQTIQLASGTALLLPPHHRFGEIHTLVEEMEANPIREGPSREDIAQIIFTSGSTATPKGVVLTHGNTLASVEPIEREMTRYLKWERPFHPIRFLVQLPLSHVFGQMLGMFLPQLMRGEVHFVPELGPAEVASTIRDRRISVMATVPRYLELLGAEMTRRSQERHGMDGFARRMQEAGRGHFLKSWWLFRDVHRDLGWKFWAFVCGGASLPEDTELLWRRLGYAVIQGYGMTETASLISVNHPFKMSRGSIGKSMAGREIRISETGEILVRGQTVSPGYWSKHGGPQPLSGDDEWFATGDLAERDADGNFYFRGRSKEVIVAANGMNIYPEDLEAALRSQTGIRDAVVVGVEDTTGPTPMALLLVHGDSVDPGSIMPQVNANLEPHQRMTRWAVWPEPDFPRTSTRKVRRAAVREYAQALVSGEPVEKLRASALEQVLNAAGARWNGELRDEWQLGQNLAVDSLGRVQLVSALEARFSISVDEGEITETTTVAALRQMVEDAMGRGSVAVADSASASSIAAEAASNAGQSTSAASTGKRQEGAAAPRKPTEQSFPFPNWPRFWWASAFRQIFLAFALRPLTRFYSARAKLVGTQNLEGLQGPCLFICNHLTSIDGALIVGRLPWRLARRFAIAMSGEMLRGYKHPAATEAWYWKLWLPIQYLLVVLCYHVFPLPRTSGVRRAFQHAGMLADRGYHLLVFPEGRRSETGDILPFQQGTGILARDLHLPVVPLWIEGMKKLKAQGRSVARRGELSIHVGRPLRFDATEDTVEITRKLEEAVRQLAAEAAK